MIEELDPAKPIEAPLSKPITGWKKEEFSLTCQHCGKPIIEVTEQQDQQSWMHLAAGGFYYWCEGGKSHLNYALPKVPEVPEDQLRACPCRHCGEEILNLEVAGVRTWLHQRTMHSGCDNKGSGPQSFAAPGLAIWDGALPLDSFVAALVEHWPLLNATSQKDMAAVIQRYEGGAEALAKHKLSV